ncbi:MAG: DNA polymerase III subunit delta [Bacteroidales bacterium]|nr:DNA polymerase III subunit delta [Bacteroidales bacterium]
MAVSSKDTGILCGQLVEDARRGVFKPVYLLMGEEPFYPDMVCDAIVGNCLQDYEKDFNETICYGQDVTAEQVITAARRFPMMAERQLVVVKDAQQLEGLDDLAVYCEDPLDSTVLVLLMRGASADKRKSLYKNIQKNGVVVESPAVRDYEIQNWIISYYASRGLSIEAPAAALLAESVGSVLSNIAVATDKLVRTLPEDCRQVRVEDIEKNVGFSRSFSVFELSRALSLRNSAAAIKIATNLGNSARFNMPMAVSALYTGFYRILKYSALLASNPRPSQEEKAEALQGVSPYFYREYDAAVRNYSLPRLMQIMSLLCEYDYQGKGGDGAALPPQKLIVELTLKILNA